MIKRASILLFLLSAIPVHAQDKKPTTLRDVLLAELKSTHGVEDWFVPANIAVKGLTAEQASWTSGKGNHSVSLRITWCSGTGRISRDSKESNLKSSAATTTRRSISLTPRLGMKRYNSSTKS